MRLITREQIDQILPNLDLLPAIEAGFVAYSAGQAVIPPVGELLLPRGDVHIKYGYIPENEYYVIKIASGFYDNPSLGLPTGYGLMLLFSQRTGELVSILLDEGRLTDIRTAVAGAVVARQLAPKDVHRIGIVGTGIQAHLQLQQLTQVVDCRDVLVWGRGEEQLQSYQRDLEPLGFNIETTLVAAEILNQCNLVVTCTPAKEPLLVASDLLPGTHITAIGADTPQKQELDAAILGRADMVVADSIEQCLVRGEIHRAIQVGEIGQLEVIELGQVIAGETAGRTTEEQITVADLTGVAVQDIVIASAVYQSANDFT
jgi:ornithine cyclodeaminase